MEIFPESETGFFYRSLPAQLEFVLQGGQAAAVVLHQNGQQQRLLRLSAEAARRVSAVFEQKAAEQSRPRIATKVCAKVLAGYVGLYRLDPLRTFVVTAEDDRLFVEVTDQGRYEVYPESERDFFWTIAAAQITFLPDETGHAASAVLHQSGRDFPLARVETQPDLDHDRAATAIAKGN